MQEIHDLGKEKAKKDRFKIFGLEAVYLYLFGIGVAFVGWIAENLARLVMQGIIDCRFHVLPFISPYALIPFAFHIVMGDPDDATVFGRKLFSDKVKHRALYSNLFCLAVLMAGVFFGELAVGNAWDMLFGVQLWNYSTMPFSVTQYAGLIPTVGYGGGAYLIFKLVYKPLMRVIKNNVSFKTAKIICLTLGVLIVLDTVCMMIWTMIMGQPPIYWSISVR